MTRESEPAHGATAIGPRSGYHGYLGLVRARGFGFGLSAALWAEALKAWRSRAPVLTALAFALAPMMGGVFMLVAKEPAWARRLGLIATKSELTVGVADWSTYLGLLTQSIAVGGLLIFGLVVIWLFGREYSDRTATDLLALPTSREAIVIAKVIVAAIWSAMLTTEVLLLGLGIGSAIGLPGWSVVVALDAARRIGVTASLTLLVVVPLALVSSAGRGYLAPVGGMILLLFLAQILVAIGWGPYFPWSVPALYSGAGGPDLPHLTLLSYLLVAGVGIGGAGLTLIWWRFVDQT